MPPGPKHKRQHSDAFDPTTPWLDSRAQSNEQTSPSSAGPRGVGQRLQACREWVVCIARSRPPLPRLGASEHCVAVRWHKGLDVQSPKADLQTARFLLLAAGRPHHLQVGAGEWLQCLDLSGALESPCSVSLSSSPTRGVGGVLCAVPDEAVPSSSGDAFFFVKGVKVRAKRTPTSVSWKPVAVSSCCCTGQELERKSESGRATWSCLGPHERDQHADFVAGRPNRVATVLPWYSSAVTVWHMDKAGVITQHVLLCACEASPLLHFVWQAARDHQQPAIAVHAASA